MAISFIAFISFPSLFLSFCFHFRILTNQYYSPFFFNVLSIHRVIKSLCAIKKTSVYLNSPHTTDDLKMAVTEYIRNVDHAILNTVINPV
jgi:hypothetical protein